MKLPIFLPENLKLSEILIDNPPSFKYNIDKFKYILNLLGELEALNRTYDTNSQEFIKINASELQSVVHDYRKYLNYLIENNVIISDCKYSPGKKSTGFMFAPTYRTLVKEDFIETWTLIRNVRNKETNKTRQCKYLDKWFDGLTVDFKSAKNYAELRRQLDERNKDKKGKRRYNSALRNLERIETKRFFIKRDKKGRRYHSNLTCLSSELRNYLTFGTEKLFSCDLKSSQPYLSCMLLNQNFFSGNENQRNSFSIQTLPKRYQNKIKHLTKTYISQQLYSQTLKSPIFLGSYF